MNDIYLTSFLAIKLLNNDILGDLEYKEILIFLLVLSCFEREKVVCKTSIVNMNNQYSNDVTYNSLKVLESKGIISSVRNKKFFSKSFISLTSKGLLLKRSLNKYLSSPLP